MPKVLQTNNENTETMSQVVVKATKNVSSKLALNCVG